MWRAAASHVEKAGSFTQTQRLVQWRDQALEPPDDARSDQMKRAKRLVSLGLALQGLRRPGLSSLVYLAAGLLGSRPARFRRATTRPSRA